MGIEAKQMRSQSAVEEKMAADLMQLATKIKDASRKGTFAAIINDRRSNYTGRVELFSEDLVGADLNHQHIGFGQTGIGLYDAKDRFIKTIAGIKLVIHETVSLGPISERPASNVVVVAPWLAGPLESFVINEKTGQIEEVAVGAFQPAPVPQREYIR